MISHLLLESCFHASAPFYHAFMHMHISFMLSCCLSVFVWLFSFLFCFFLNKNKKKKIRRIQKQCMFCVPWMAIETKSSKLCIICSLDEHLYAQLSKWALFLLFVMSKIKFSYTLHSYHSFWWEGLENPKRKA